MTHAAAQTQAQTLADIVPVTKIIDGRNVC